VGRVSTALNSHGKATLSLETNLVLFAGVPLRDIVASCSAGYLESTPLLDLNHTEEAGGGPDVFVVLHPHLDKIIVLEIDSKLSLDNMESVRSAHCVLDRPCSVLKFEGKSGPGSHSALRP
jgi:ribonuclease PH